MNQHPRLAKKEFLDVIRLKVIKFIGSIYRSFILSDSKRLFPTSRWSKIYLKMKTVALVLLLLWGIPSTYFRSKFRKLVYQTDDWKINIKPLFKRELQALFGNLFPNDKAYLRLRQQYRIYLFIYLLLFLWYKMI